MHRRRSCLGSVAPVLAALAVVAATGCAPGSATTDPDAGGTGEAGARPDATTDAASDQLVVFDTGLEGGPVACADPTDTDGDSIADAIEGKGETPPTDTDGDGTPDYLDTDSDGDGWLDADEAANPHLQPGEYGQKRTGPCDQVADSDADGIPDFRQLDSDGDSIADADERDFDPQGKFDCRVLPDCDGDGYEDIIELAAKSDPTDPNSVPAPGLLFFKLPYGIEQTKDFTFSSGLSDADIYFLVDTTASMQQTIDGVASSLDTTIIPSILNGDPTAHPPIPAIANARIGIGDFRDVPWSPYGTPDDDVYRTVYDVNGAPVSGAMADPKLVNGSYAAPDAVKQILGTLTAGGGGDSPEATTQALWMAATNQDYFVYGGGTPWQFTPQACPAGTVGAPCFRSTALPIFVLITDAPFHDGADVHNDYDEGFDVNGTVQYTDTVAALNQINAKIVGVPVNTGLPGAARSDMIDLANQTDSTWDEDAFGGTTHPLVTASDTSTGDVSKEVVRLIGLLAGEGLKNVTTKTTNYACAGGVDCNGDGVVDPAYENLVVPPETVPFDASRLILSVEPQPSTATPLPYKMLDATTFYGVKGDAQLTFRVHAENTIVRPTSLIVVRAELRVQTPKGIVLGGKNGVKVVYFILPKYVPGVH